MISYLLSKILLGLALIFSLTLIISSIFLNPALPFILFLVSMGLFVRAYHFRKYPELRTPMPSPRLASPPLPNPSAWVNSCDYLTPEDKLWLMDQYKNPPKN